MRPEDGRPASKFSANGHALAVGPVDVGSSDAGGTTRQSVPSTRVANSRVRSCGESVQLTERCSDLVSELANIRSSKSGIPRSSKRARTRKQPGLPAPASHVRSASVPIARHSHGAFEGSGREDRDSLLEAGCKGRTGGLRRSCRRRGARVHAARRAPRGRLGVVPFRRGLQIAVIFAGVNIAITAVSPNAHPEAEQVLETTEIVEAVTAAGLVEVSSQTDVHC